MDSKQRRTDRRLSNTFEGGWLLLDSSSTQSRDLKKLQKIADKRFKLRRRKK